jgi:hypothetical protein
MTRTESEGSVIESTDRRRSRWMVVVLVLLALAPLVVVGAHGALGVVRNDDWAWAEILWNWSDTGDLRLNGWPSMFLIGQLALAWPIAQAFPHELVALEVFSTALGVVGALASYWILRLFLPPTRAALAAGLVLLTPLYGSMAPSFMTDVPAFGLEIAALAVGVAALRATSFRREVMLLLASAGLAIVAATIREYAIAAILTIITVGLLRAVGRRSRDELIAFASVGGATVLFYGGLLVWRRSWSGSLNFNPSLPPIGDLGGDIGRSVTFVVVTLAFLVLPAFLFIPLGPVVRAITARRWTTVAAGGALAVGLVGIVSTWDWGPPILGTYLDQFGSSGNDYLPGERPLVLPSFVLQSLLAATFVAAVLLVAVFALVIGSRLASGSSWRQRCAALDVIDTAIVFVIANVGVLIAVGITGLPVFDRYLLPVVPFAAGIVLARASRPRGDEGLAPLWVRWGGVVLFALVGLAWTTDSAAYDVARWRLAEDVVDLGYRPDQVEAGFEWRNVQRAPDSGVTAPAQWDTGACVRLSSGTTVQPDAEQVLLTRDYRGWFGPAGSVTAYATAAPNCPPLP